MKLILTLTVLVAAAMAQQDDHKLHNLLTVGNHKFSARMFSEVLKSNPGKSVIMSAFSVLTPLAQFSLASEGESHDELLKAIGLPDDDAIKVVFSHLNKKLGDVKGIELKTASKIYVAEDSELNPEFSEVTKDIFNSEVKKVDFRKNTHTTREINSWVEQQTNNHIKDLISPEDLDSNIRSIFVNAIYFKGKWDIPFDKKSTKEEDFYISKDKIIKVSMMHKQANYRYADSKELNAQLLELPYTGGEASFIVVLPKAIDGLAALVEKFKDPSVLISAVAKMDIYDVKVALPKFKIETKIDLKDILEKMDVHRVFDSHLAHFNRLLKGENTLFVSKAMQKAFIEVNEEGAEADAGNKMVTFTRVMANNRKGSAEVKMDHPFVFGIKIKDDIIFTGTYINK